MPNDDKLLNFLHYLYRNVEGPLRPVYMIFNEPTYSPTKKRNGELKKGSKHDIILEDTLDKLCQKLDAPPYTY